MITNTAVFAAAKTVTISNAGAATQNLAITLEGDEKHEFIVDAGVYVLNANHRADQANRNTREPGIIESPIEPKPVMQTGNDYAEQDTGIPGHDHLYVANWFYHPQSKPNDGEGCMEWHGHVSCRFYTTRSPKPGVMTCGIHNAHNHRIVTERW